MRKYIFLWLSLVCIQQGYSQCANAGRDTIICGYNTGLRGSPIGGTWSFLCSDSLSFIELSSTSPQGIAGVTVPSCATYQFVYSVDQMGCVDSDTVTLSFEDPSNQTRKFSYDIELTYGAHNCPELREDTCSNVRILIGANPPRPRWTIMMDGICDANFPDPIVTNIDSATCTAVVNHIGMEKVDTLDLLWVSSQDAFITTDYQKGEIIENRFIEFVDILQNGLSGRLDTACSTFGKCFIESGMCADTIFDTLSVEVPVHIGGRWNIINQGGVIPLNDTTDITQEGKEYRVVMNPGARYFGPNNIRVEVFGIDQQGGSIDLDSTVELIIFWEEEWVLDTLHRITHRFDISGNCPPCGTHTLIQDSILFPDIPTTVCPTLELEFNPPIQSKITGNTFLCEGRFVVLSGPEGKMSYEWSDGTTSRFNFVMNPGEVKLTTIDSAGCSTRDSVQIVQVVKPDYQLQGDTSAVCKGECVEYDIVGDTVEGYFWSNQRNADTINTYCFSNDSLIWVEVEDLLGCFYRDTFTIEVDEIFNIDAGFNQELTCSEEFVFLFPDTTSLDTVIYFEWQGPGIVDSNRHINTPKVAQPGLYFLLVGSDSLKCLGRDSVRVSFSDDRPTADAGANRLINCKDSVVVLNGSMSQTGPDFILTWIGPGITVNNQNETSPQISQPGTYILSNCNTVTGCCDKDTVAVGLNKNQPRADAGEMKFLSCDTTSVELGGPLTSSGINVIYEWSGPGINQSNENVKMPEVGLPGQYFLRVVDTVSFCESIDGVIISTRGSIPVASAGADMVLTCDNPTVTLDSDASSAGPNVDFTWEGPGINAGNQNDKKPVIDMAGTYILTLTDDQSNCVDMDTVIVENLIRLPEIKAGDPDTIDCNVRAVRILGEILNNNGNMVISWTGNGINPSNKDIIRPDVTVGGRYVLKVTDTTNNCVSRDTVMIIENFDPASPNAGDDLNITCDQSEVILQGELINFNPDDALFSWEGPDIDFNKMFLLTPGVSLPGEYILSINAVNDRCDLSDTVVVGFDTIPPSFTIDGDEIIGCKTDTAQLMVTLQQGSIGSVSWSTQSGRILGRNDQTTVSAIQSGVYIVEVTGENGCTSIDSFVVSEWTPFQVEIQTDSTCEGDDDGFARLLIQGGAFPFRFSLNGGPFVNTTFFDSLPGGMYTVRVVDKNDCGRTFNFEIKEVELIDLEDEFFERNLCESDNLIIGDNFGLTDPQYRWLDNPGANIKRSVQDTGTYILQIFNSCDTVEFEYEVASDVLPESQNQVFRMPNAFTPNADRLNDSYGPVWQIERINEFDFQMYSFEIYNRWGEMLMMSNDINETWDGLIEGDPAPPQGYFYKIKMQVMDCRGTVLQFKKEGTVALIR